MPPAPEYHNPKQDSSGAIVATIIILVLVVAGAAYFWSERNDTQTNTLPYITGDTSTTSVQ